MSEIVDMAGSFIKRLPIKRTVGVFEQLGITFTREEWAAFNAKAGTDYPYPFADVVAIRNPRPTENSIMGMRVVADPSVPADTARIINPDGSIAAEIVNIKPSTD